jgi:hypothetical protein
MMHVQDVALWLNVKAGEPALDRLFTLHTTQPKKVT